MKLKKVGAKTKKTIRLCSILLAVLIFVSLAPGFTAFANEQAGTEGDPGVQSDVSLENTEDIPVVDASDGTEAPPADDTAKDSEEGTQTTDTPDGEEAGDPKETDTATEPSEDAGTKAPAIDKKADNSSDAEDSEALKIEKELALEEEAAAEEAEEAEEEEELAEVMDAVVMAPSLNAQFTQDDGSVVNLNGADDTVFLDIANAVNTGHKLKLLAVFSEGSANKTLTITLAPGLAFTKIPGWEATDITLKNWVRSTSPANDYPNDYRDTIENVTYTQAAPLAAYPSANGTPYQPCAGTLTYTFKTGDTTGVEIDLDVALDPRFALTAYDPGNILNTRTFKNCISVSSAENGSPIGTVGLENYTVEGTVRPRISNGQVHFKTQAVDPVPPGTPVEPTKADLRYRAYIYDDTVLGNPRFDTANQQMIFEQATYTFRYRKDYFLPTGLTLPATPTNNSITQANIDAANATWQLNETGSGQIHELLPDTATYNYVTFTFPYFDSSTAYFCISGVIPKTPVVAARTDYAINHNTDTPNGGMVSSEFTLYNSGGSGGINVHRYAVDGGTLHILPPGEGSSLQFDELDNKVVSEYTLDHPADVVSLGGFRLTNYSGSDTTVRHQMSIDFTEGSGYYGVRAVKLMAEKSQTLAINYTTNKGSGTANITVGDTYWPLVTVDQLVGTAAPDEYITSVTYEMGVIPGGLMTSRYGLQDASYPGIYYYGHLLSVPDTSTGDSANYGRYYATATLKVESDSSGAPGVFDKITGSGTNNDEPKKQEILAYHKVSGPKSIRYNVTGNANQTAGTGLLAGYQTSEKVSMTINSPTLNYRSVNSPHLIDCYDDLRVYLRDTETLAVLKNSIEYTIGSETKTANEIAIDEWQDEADNTVYSFVIPDVILGGYIYSPTGLTKYTAPVVKYHLKADLNTVGGPVSLSKIATCSVDTTAVKNGDIDFKAVNYHVTEDIDNVSGFGIDDFRLGASSGNISTQPNKNFLVFSGSGYGDGIWGTYNPSDPATRIQLNPAGEAWYQTRIVNNSPSNITGGYELMIPIPKEGQDSGNASIQADPFEWSMYVEEDLHAQMIRNNVVSASANMTVLYCTDYYFSKDNGTSTWQTWDAVKSNPKAIKTVKIISTDDLSAGDDYELYFSLGIPTREEADANSLHGNINTFASRTYRAVGGNTGYVYSELVSVALNLHSIEGTMYVDGTNEKISGASVDAIHHTSSSVYESLTTKTDGSFATLGLLNDSAAYVKLDITNPRPVVNGEIKKDSLRFAPGQQLDISADHTKATTSVALNPDVPGAGDHCAFHIKMEAPKEVQFDGNLPSAGITLSPLYQFKGEKIAEPTKPSQHGYTFNGWYKSKEGAAALDSSDLWNFGTDAVPSDITLYAGWEPFAGPTVNLAQDEITLNTNPDKNGGVSLKDYTEQMLLDAINATLVSNIPGGSAPTISTDFSSVKPADGFVYADGPYYVNVTATDSAGHTTTVRVKINIEDDTPPVITPPARDMTLRVPLGKQLTADELGALVKQQFGDFAASDDSAGVSIQYDLSGVNFNVPGSYKAKVFAVDAAGNISDMVDITIIVEGGAVPLAATTSSTTPKTGDPTNLALWISLIVGCVAALLIVVAVRRSKLKKQS